jgi:pilus assembly protein CpaE
VDALDRLLEVARQEFDFVIIDGGSKLDLKHTNSFHESDTIYLVTQVGVPELRNANRLISEFTAVDGPDLDIVINRYDPRSQVITEQSIEKALTKPARWRIPNDYAAVQRMLNSANPLADEDSPVSRTILQMARYVSGRPEPSEEPKNSGLFGWKVSRV